LFKPRERLSPKVASPEATLVRSRLDSGSNKFLTEENEERKVLFPQDCFDIRNIFLPQKTLCSLRFLLFKSVRWGARAYLAAKSVIRQPPTEASFKQKKNEERKVLFTARLLRSSQHLPTTEDSLFPSLPFCSI
jgi:hypothetical protein